LGAKTPETLKHSRDKEITRATILAAAEQEFARHGFEAATTEGIAERSGVTKGMIFHYFGSKEKLYEAALEQVFAPLLISLQRFALPDQDPEAALEGVMRRILELSARRHGVPAMLFYEAIQNRGAFYDRIGFPSLYHVIATILESGTARRVFRPLDPWHTAVNIVGTCCFYYCISPRLQPLWPGNSRPLSAEMMGEHAEQVIALVLNGVRAFPRCAD
jgi:AcrR family transcriptional regulator